MTQDSPQQQHHASAGDPAAPRQPGETPGTSAEVTGAPDDNLGALPEVSQREAELEAELAKTKDQLLRAMAETENVRRRLEQQAEDRGKYAVATFAKEMLQVADNLRRALDNLPAEQISADPLAHKLAEGVELTERALLASREKFGIQKIQSVGQRFDPNFHQAMMEVEDPSKPSGTVVLEMQAGYIIHGRLLREAMVGVSKGGPKPQPGDAGVDTTA